MIRLFSDFFTPDRVAETDKMRSHLKNKLDQLSRALDDDTPSARELAQAVLDEVRKKKSA